MRSRNTKPNIATVTPRCRTRWTPVIGVAVVVALMVAACGSPDTTGQKSETGTTFEDVIRLAKKEGTVEVWAYTDEERAALEKGMNGRFGTSIDVTGQELSAGDAATRLITEAQAGKAKVDFLQPSFDIAMGLAARELLPDKYPWKEVFGGELDSQKLEDAVESVEADFLAGRGLNHRDVIYSIVYRTDKIAKSELPTRWLDLADPKYAGRFAIDVRGYPFNYLGLALGEEDTFALVRDIKANRPLLRDGSDDAGAAVNSGEVPFAVGGFDVKAKLSGLPLAVHYVEPVPLNQLVAIVPPTSPHPNAGRLFAAYVATEGFKLLEDKGIDYAARATDEELAYSAELHDQVQEPEFVRVQSKDDLDLLARLTAEIGRILSGQQ